MVSRFSRVICLFLGSVPRVCARAEVLGEELREALVQILDAILLQRDTHVGLVSRTKTS
jgi:hypothetical protein